MVLCVRQHLLVPFSVEENICYLNHLNPLNNERHVKSSSFFYILLPPNILHFDYFSTISIVIVMYGYSQSNIGYVQ